MVERVDPTQSPFLFDVDGTPLAGQLFTPPEGTEWIASAVLTGPLTSVKEQATGAYARALASRGIRALAFDHRTFGESGGEPRQVENPFAKMADIDAARQALAKAQPAGLPMLGIGICAGGGYMAGAVAGYEGFDAFVGIAGYYGEVTGNPNDSPSVKRGLEALHEWEETGLAPTIPAVAEQGGDVAMPLREAYEYYGTPRGAVPNYRNTFAVQSFALTGRFDSQAAAAKINVPSLVIHSENALAPALARKFIANLTAGCQELWLQSEGQIDFYDEPSLIAQASDSVAAFVKDHVTAGAA